MWDKEFFVYFCKTFDIDLSVGLEIFLKEIGPRK